MKKFLTWMVFLPLTLGFVGGFCGYYVARLIACMF